MFYIRLGECQENLRGEPLAFSFIFFLFFYFDRPPHRDLSLLSQALSSLIWEEEKEKENRRRRLWVDWFWCFICWCVRIFEDFWGWFGLIFLQVDFLDWFCFISAGWFWVGWFDFDFSAGWFFGLVLFYFCRLILGWLVWFWFFCRLILEYRERKSEKRREWRNEGREKERDRWWWFFFLKLFQLKNKLN
jgi:hypothetical protein